MTSFLALGPNMRRLGEMDLSDSVGATVVSGPGDLLVWEVHAMVKMDGLPVRVAGRGTDIESSAAAVLALLEQDPDSFDLA